MYFESVLRISEGERKTKKTQKTWKKWKRQTKNIIYESNGDWKYKKITIESGREK